MVFVAERALTGIHKNVKRKSGTLLLTVKMGNGTQKRFKRPFYKFILNNNERQSSAIKSRLILDS